MDSITLPSTLFTVSSLTTLAGLVAAVYVIVSFIKEPLKQKFGDWIVRPAAVVVAMVIMLWLIFVQGPVTLELIGLAIINAFLVALIAGAAHDYIVAPTKAQIPVAEQPTVMVNEFTKTANEPDEKAGSTPTTPEVTK